jgi:hypothetical protein
MSRLDPTPQLPPLAGGNDSLSIRDSVMDSDPADKASITATSLLPLKEASTILEADGFETQKTPVDVQPFVTVDQGSTAASSAPFRQSLDERHILAGRAVPQGPSAASKSQSVLSYRETAS